MTGARPTAQRQPRVGRYRPHAKSGRPRQVRLRYTDEEYQTVERAAQAAGLTPTGYVAEAALAAATSLEPPRDAPWRSALLELMDTRNQIRRIGININQAARILNTTGETPVWLEHALAITTRSVTTVDDAAAAVAALALWDGAARRSASSPDAPAAGAAHEPPPTVAPDAVTIQVPRGVAR